MKQIELSKKCSKCGEYKPLDSFYFSRGMCKKCKIAWIVKHQRENWEEHKAYKRQLYWRNHQKEMNRKSQNQINAYRTIQEAIRRGELIKPEYCEICGRDGKLEAHHYAGYNRPNWLKVIWLCTGCHGAKHAKTA